jgi:hypothetical protein
VRYRLKPKSQNIYACVFKDKEINVVTGNALKKEINKELETWLTWGYIKDYYKEKYSKELIEIIEGILKKYHKKYKGLWEQAQILEKKYAETDLEEMEEAYEMTMAQVQIEKNKLYEDTILPEINKELKDKGFI